jgi:putative FmdB family regulatory protein
MRVPKAGMAIAAAFSVVAFAAAIMLPDSGYLSSHPAPVASQSMAALSTTPIRVNGSRPLLPQRALQLSGEIIGLPPDTSGITVTVRVGGRLYPANLQGQTYSVDIGYPPVDAMVLIEAYAHRIRYQTVPGSVQRLRSLAGSDGRLSLAEHSALRVSPFSTALASAVRFVLGGRDAGSDSEFADAVRSGTNGDLELAAFVLEQTAFYPEDIPAPHQNGYDLLQDRAKFRQFAAYPWVTKTARGHLFRQDQGVPLRSLSELPNRLLLQDGLPYGEVAMKANDVLLLNRLPDGSYELHEDEAWNRPRFRASLGDNGVVELRPIERVWRGFNNEDQNTSGVELAVESYALRRMAIAADGVEVWAVSATYLGPDSYSGPRVITSFRVFAAVGLDAWAETGGWPSLTSIARPLPWFCETYTEDNPLLHWDECDYVQHQFRITPAGSGATLEHGWNLDPATMAPVVPSGSQPFGWSLTAGGVLTVARPESETQFWRLRQRQAAVGVIPHSLGTVVYLTRSRQGSTAGQTRVGLSMTAARTIGTVSADRGRDIWEHSSLRSERNLYTGRAPTITRVTRRADGSATIIVSSDGVIQAQFEQYWDVAGGAIYEGRAVGYMPSGLQQVFRSCAQAIAAGATLCVPQHLVFRPITISGDRVYGILMNYEASITYDSDGNRTMLPLERSRPSPASYTCLTGSCGVAPSTAVASSSMPVSWLTPGAGSRSIEFHRAAPKVSRQRAFISALMPIYAYECTQCGHSFDRLQKLSDPDPDTCPECSTVSVKRQVTAPSFRLAGSGWYETDFKKDGDKKRNLADSGDGAAKPAGDSKPAEAAPAAKADAKPEAKPAAAASTPAV